MIKIVSNNEVIRYFKKDREVRLDYVSVLTSSNLIIPIYYYTNEQKQSYTFNSMDISKQELLDKLDSKVIAEEIDKLKSLGYKIVGISYLDNLHTHPVGTMSWSGTDMAYTLKPEWSGTKGAVVGSNMLYSFKGELYKAIVRLYENGEYTYEDTETVELDTYKPSFKGVDEEDFIEKTYSIKDCLHPYILNISKRGLDYYTKGK